MCHMLIEQLFYVQPGTTCLAQALRAPWLGIVETSPADYTVIRVVSITHRYFSGLNCALLMPKDDQMHKMPNIHTLGLLELAFGVMTYLPRQCEVTARF